MNLGRSSALAVIGLATIVCGCLTAGPGSCSPPERQFFEAIEHFGREEIEAQDHPLGICGATFTADATADEVAAHYFDQFQLTGWDEVRPPATMGASGEPSVTGRTTVSAYEGTYQYHVEISTLESGAVHVNITAGDAQG
jgi:hypothetical protein